MTSFCDVYGVNTATWACETLFTLWRTSTISAYKGKVAMHACIIINIIKERNLKVYYCKRIWNVQKVFSRWYATISKYVIV